MAITDLITEYDTTKQNEEEKQQTLDNIKLGIFQKFCEAWLNDAQELLSGLPLMVANNPAIELKYNQQQGFIRFDGQKFIMTLDGKTIELKFMVMGSFAVPLPLTAGELVPLINR